MNNINNINKFTKTIFLSLFIFSTSAIANEAIFDSAKEHLDLESSNRF